MTTVHLTYMHVHTNILTLSASCLVPTSSGMDIWSRVCVGASAGPSESAGLAAGKRFLSSGIESLALLGQFHGCLLGSHDLS